VKAPIEKRKILLRLHTVKITILLHDRCCPVLIPLNSPLESQSLQRPFNFTTVLKRFKALKDALERNGDPRDGVRKNRDGTGREDNDFVLSLTFRTSFRRPKACNVLLILQPFLSVLRRFRTKRGR
jgi:hypothetical protein